MWSSDFVSSQPLGLQLTIAYCGNFLQGEDTTYRQAIAARMTPHDWHDFLFWVKRHKLASIVASDEIMVTDNCLPQFVANEIVQIRQASAVKALAVFRETLTIQTLLDEHQVSCAFVKGVVLSQQLFGDCTMRETNDVDLFVPRDQIDAAEITLLNAGYRQITPMQPLTKRQRESFLYFGRHLIYCHPHNQAHIELHWQFGGNPHCVPDIDLIEMLKQVATVEVYGYPIKTFSSIDTFLFLLIHGWLHHWAEIKWLFDIAILISQLSEKVFVTLHARAINLGLERAFASTLALLRTVFGNFLPAWLNKYTTKSAGWLVRQSLSVICQRDISYLEKPRQRLIATLLETQLQRSLRYKLFHLYRLNFSTDDWYQFPLPDQLFPLYVLLHPLLWVRQRFS